MILTRKEDALTDLLGLNLKKSGELNLLEAETWFNNTYMSRFSNLEKTGEKDVQRIVDWKNAQLINDRDKNEFLIAPVEYATNERPAHLSWTKETEFIPKLAHLYFQPAIEVLVVSREKDYQAYLFQITYDRFAIRDKTLRFEELTGYVKKCEWDETQLITVKYDKGKALYISSNTEKAKISQAECYYEEIEGYTTTTIIPNNDSHPEHGICLDGVEVTYHRRYALKCYSAVDNTYVAHPLSPIIQNWTVYHNVPSNSHPYAPFFYNYNINNAVCRPGSDRIEMNESLSRGLTAKGLTAGTIGWTFDKADALIRTIGGTNMNYNGVLNVAGKVFGYASFYIGAIPAVVGLFDGEVTQLDVINGLGTVIGGTALVITGWPAVIAGGVSVGIAIYVTANTPPSTVPVCSN